MKNKIVNIITIIIISLLILTTKTYAGVSTNDPVVKEGEKISITVTASKPVSSFKIVMKSSGGLTFKSVTKSASFEMGASNGSTVNGITTRTPSSTLATYVFEAPNISKTTKYNVQFSVSGMDTESDASNTSVVTVNVPKEVTPPTTTPEPEKPKEPTTSKSSNNSLKNLTISPFGTISKASNGTYDITVKNSTKEVTISAVTSHAKAKITSGMGKFKLDVGTNYFPVVVTAENGDKKTHKIYVRKESAEKTEPVTPPNVVDKEEPKKEEKTEKLELSNLVISGLKLSPEFDNTVFEYAAEIENTVDELEVIAKSSDKDAKIEIIGNKNLKVGENIITIIIKSSNEKDKTLTYQIVVTKKEAEATAPVIGNVIDNVNNEKESNTFDLEYEVGKILLIAIALIMIVLLIGIFVITKLRKSYSSSEKIGKNDFINDVSEEDSYGELERLKEIHDKNDEAFNDYEADKDFEVIDETKNNMSDFTENDSDKTGFEIENTEELHVFDLEKEQEETDKYKFGEYEKEVIEKNEIFENSNNNENTERDEFLNSFDQQERPKTEFEKEYEEILKNKDTPVMLSSDIKNKKSKGKRFK